MAAGGVVAFKLVVYLRRCFQLFLKAVGPHQRGGTVHFVKISYLLGNLDIAVVVVQLLPDKIVAEHRTQIVKAHGLAGAGIQQRSGLDLHVGPDVIPCRGHFGFFKIDFVRDFLF